MGNEEKKDTDSARSKAGPYNYCDYRCDRCDEIDRCKVYKEDQERLLEHYLKGEDPDDPDVFVNDLKEIFKRTRKMLEQMAEEQGIELDELAAEDLPRVDPEEFVLYNLANDYFMSAHDFIKEIEASGLPPDVEDDFEDLIWYHGLILAKTGRLISGTVDFDSIDEDIRKEEEEGTLRVINKGIGISKQALKNMVNGLPDHLLTIADLMGLIKKIERQIQTNIYQKTTDKT